jgi:membrane-bound lytic murein transglycosylase MltF
MKKYPRKEIIKGGHMQEEKCYKESVSSLTVSIITGLFLIIMIVSGFVFYESLQMKKELKNLANEIEIVLSIETRKTAFINKHKERILEKQPRATEYETTVMLAQVFDYCERFDQEKDLVMSLISNESSCYKYARSPVGAMGYMQLMPATARLCAVWVGKLNYDIIDDNIELGMIYLSILRECYSDERAIASYNAGERNYKISMDYGRKVVGDVKHWQ